MPKKPYSWEQGKIPVIEPHTRAKHRILREYVQEYLRVLTSFRGMPDFHITLVDGFAGGCVYHEPGSSDIHFGSPLILFNAVQEATRNINLDRKKPVDINARYLFIEKHPRVYQFLRETIERESPKPIRDERVELINDDFSARLDDIIASIKNAGARRRAIFVLDQYGYTGAPIDMIYRIFRELPKAEVFLTLAVGWIAAYLGANQPIIDTLRDALQVPQVELSHLNDQLVAFEDEEHPVEPLDGHKMFLIQRILHDTFTQRAGARCYTPFYIMSRESNRPYWFLHLANSSRANDVVKQLHWNVQNHFAHFGGAGLDMMLGYDPDRDPTVTGQMVFAFDDAARIRTSDALASGLPRRIHSLRREWIPFRELYDLVCNETPASREILRQDVTRLCQEGELEKRGAEGESRRTSTAVQDDDRLRYPKQPSFSFLKKPE